MKKATIIIYTVLLLLCAIFLAACGHEHTPGKAVRENEIAPTYEQDGSYDEVIYCTECNEEISRTKKSTPKLTDADTVYTILFVVEGKVTEVPTRKGEIPVFNGTPQKEESVEYVFTFKGWNKELVAATEDTTYVARFTKELREYDVTFTCDGNTVATSKVKYSENISFPADKKAPEKNGAVLFMWTNTSEPCKGDTVCEARFGWGDPEALKWAYNYEIIKYSGIYDGDYDTDPRANAFLYLTLSERHDHNEEILQRVLMHIRSLITPGQEPSFTAGPFWHYASVSLAFMVSKYTPTIWNELSADEKARIDLLMECYAVATCFVSDDDNNYKTGVSLMGNHNKSWNPNHRLAMTLPIVASTVYFSYGGANGAEYVNNIFLNFDYDSFISKFDNYGFSRIKTCWSTPGYLENGVRSPGAKELLTSGGTAIYATKNDGGDLIGLTLGENLGSGVGVKGNYFTYFGIPLTNLAGIVEHMYAYTYSGGAVVSDSSAMPGGVDKEGKPLAYIIDGTKSPVEGEIGMMYEMISGDGMGIRSAITYSSHDLNLVVQSMAALEFVGAYEHDKTSELFKKIWIGNTDVIYKYTHGYHGFSLGQGREDFDNETTKYTLWKTYWLSQYAHELTLYRDINYQDYGAELNSPVNSYKYDESNAQMITLPNVSRDNFEFKGWFFDEDFTLTELDGLKIENGKLLIPRGYSSHVKLYAKFLINGNFKQIIYPKNVALPENAPHVFEIGSVTPLLDGSRDGYLFAGWYRDAALTVKITEISATDDSDVTLYAKWTAIYIDEDFTKNTTTDVLSAGTVGSLSVNGNNGSSSFSAQDGHLVWRSSAGWGFTYLNNNMIRNGSSDVFTTVLSLARPNGQNVAPIYFRLRDANKNDIKPFSITSADNAVKVDGVAIMTVPEIKDGFATLKITVDFANGRVYYYDGDNTLLYTQVEPALTTSFRQNLHEAVGAPNLVCNPTNGQTLSILIDKILVFEGGIS